MTTATRIPGLVSVIMPVYRGEQFVGSAIESVLAQTYRPVELVIVNDGSPDDSAREIARFLRHPQIRYVEQENAGVAAARNTGVASASGDLIALLDQDDLWLPEKLEHQVAYLDSRPDVGLVHSRVECIDAVGQLCTCNGAIWVYPFEGLCAGQLLLGNGIAGVTVLIRAECIDDVGGFEQHFAPADDWELWMRVARRYPLGFCDQVTARYRVHCQNVSRDQLKMQRMILKIIDSICERFPDVVESVSADRLAFARHRALRGAALALEGSGRPGEARSYWREAFKTRGNLEALLAILRVRPTWRSTIGGLLAHEPEVSRALDWYAYKVSRGRRHHRRSTK